MIYLLILKINNMFKIKSQQMHLIPISPRCQIIGPWHNKSETPTFIVPRPCGQMSIKEACYTARIFASMSQRANISNTGLYFIEKKINNFLKRTADYVFNLLIKIVQINMKRIICPKLTQSPSVASLHKDKDTKCLAFLYLFAKQIREYGF